jgi:hypothetical protein
MTSVTNLNENKIFYMLCDCDSEVLVIKYDNELGIADLAIYESNYSFKSKMSLWQRFRYCWRVLFHKTPYSDQMVLKNTHLIGLKNFISSLDLETT